MLGDDKFEIRPMGRGFVKIGGAETDPADIKLAEECWQAGRDAIYAASTISSSSRNQLHHQLQNARRR